MKNLFLITGIVLISAVNVFAQSNYRSSGSGSGYASFIDFQKTFPRPDESFRRKQDTLQKQFAAKKLKWPANYIYIRSFKYDSQLEVWVKDELTEPFKLFKTYKVCALAGTLGPKRIEGDYQVPEGFYYINEFNPRSQYYLSLGLNYPNVSDLLLSDSLRPGSAIYIHGSCVTVGCIPITDQQIDELYVLAAHAKNQGQDYIPVHIFPIRYNVQRSASYLSNMTKDDAYLKRFSDRLSDAFYYFEKHKQLPVVMINEKGEYNINEPVIQKAPEVKVKPKRTPVAHRQRNITNLVDAVHQWPQFPGGGADLMKHLEKIGEKMAEHLPEGVKKVYAQVEFIVDVDGKVVNVKVLKSVNDDDFNDELITQLEKMPDWKPALLHGKAVPQKMVQTITVEAKEEKEAS